MPLQLLAIKDIVWGRIKNKDLTKGIKTAERREKLHVANIKENLIEFGGIIDYKGMIEK